MLHRDTLVSVRVKLGSQAGVEGEVKARQQWDHVQDSLVALYGEPDSVRITNLSECASDALQMKRLEASWGPFTPTEPWGLLYTVIETTYDGITVTQPQLVSAQLRHAVAPT